MSNGQPRLLPPIYVDLDDVLAETLRAFSRVALRLYGREVPFNQIHSFDLAKSFDLSPDQHKHFMHVAHQPDVLLDEIEPVAHSRETLLHWSHAGAHITVVTGRPTSTYDATHAWLRRHDFPFQSLRFVRKYGRGHVSGPLQPLDIRTLSRASFAFAVEDSARMADYIVSRVRIPVILLDKPWNIAKVRAETAPLLIRCKTWGEARSAGLQQLQWRKAG